MYKNLQNGFLVFAFMYFSQPRFSLAQNTSTDGNIIISEVIEDAISSTDEDSDPSEISEEMTGFLDHPLNLNRATTEELRQLQLLTEFQIYALTNYIHEQGDLLSVYELQLVYGFDRELITRLIPFVCLIPGTSISVDKADMKKQFRQLLILRAGFDRTRKKGFIPETSEIEAFEGANRALMLRYEAGISNFNFGFTAEQDAGESFTSGEKLFRPDFTSGYLEFKGIGMVKKIIIGDYKASWGQGLVLGGYGIRKGSQVLLSPQSTGLKKYSSPGENNFFRGAAAKIVQGNLSLEIIASHLRIDAVLHEISADTASDYYFSSPDLSGLHRNEKEIENKDAVICNNYGGHAQYTKNNFVLGFSYLVQQYDKTWSRNNSAFTQETFKARNFIQNFGTDFKFSLGKIAVFGEIASDTKTRIAIFAGILADLHPLVRLSLVYRNYQPDYLGLRSSGFGESRGTKNEEGYYLGLQIYPWKYLKADLYADHYSFPFLRYNSTSPCSGNDYLLNLSSSPIREFIINMRFRYEKNQNRSDARQSGIGLMQTNQKGSYRLELAYDLNKNLKLKSRIEFSYFQNAQKPWVTGFYSGHDLNLQSNSQKYKLWIRYAIYDIPQWENRVYAYENDVLYSFSVPAFNSKGARIIIMTKADLLPGLELSIRFALSQFQGIRTRGSGNDEVNGSNESYWTLQLRFRL